MNPPKTAKALLYALWSCAVLLPASAALAHEDRETREPRETERGHENEPRDDNRGEDGRGERADDDSHKGSGSDDSRSRHGGRREDNDRASRHGPRIEFERDSHGVERVRGEILVVGSESELAAISAAGFTILERQTLQSLDAQMGRVRVEPSRSIDSTLDELRRLVPNASLAPQNLFRPSAATAPSYPVAGTRTMAATAGRIGIIDTGVGAGTPALQRSLIERRAFTAGGYVPRAHGTAVAQVASGAGASLLSADVFGLDADDRLAATTLAVAQAVDWLVTTRVRVLNISLEGPDNPVLARVIRRAIASDVAIVAAAGNEGPSAPPAYPAAYDGVIAVTAVDQRGRVYRRANRGGYILFAARGVDIAFAGTEAGARKQSGTSFAAPLVAAALATRLANSPSEHIAEGIAALARSARDLGTPGRDDTYGWGEIVLVPAPTLGDATRDRP